MTFAQKGHQFITRPDWPTLAAFGLPLILYVLTLAPTIYNLDSAELTTAAATGGITRATGYPLYLVLGKMWSWLPFGDVGYRMNLFSAVGGAMTILLAERILRRLHVGPWARFGALGLLASAYYFWALSLIAEVYTLHTALMAGAILLLLRWAEAPGPLRLAHPAHNPQPGQSCRHRLARAWGHLLRFNLPPAPAFTAAGPGRRLPRRRGWRHHLFVPAPPL
jgi:hypothetical protein